MTPNLPSPIDVLVAGAGPAGTAAAAHLARGGARVLLVEARQRLAVKPCAGGLTRHALAEAPLPDAVPRRASSAIRVVSSAGPAWLEDDGPLVTVIDRGAWLEHRLREAQEAGVIVARGVRLLDVTGPGTAATSHGVVRAGAVVDATGAGSRLRRSTGLAGGDRLRTVQLVVPEGRWPGPIPPLTVWYDPPRIGAGYGWIFPGPGEIRVGAGGRAARLPFARLHEALAAFLSTFGLRPESGALRSAFIGCDYAGHRFDRLWLAGDAAGLASPLTGEGIHQALVSGREIAREILEPGYRSTVLPALGRRHRRTLAVLERPGLAALLYPRAAGAFANPVLRRIILDRYVY